MKYFFYLILFTSSLVLLSSVMALPQVQVRVDIEAPQDSDFDVDLDSLINSLADDKKDKFHDNIFGDWNIPALEDEEGIEIGADEIGQIGNMNNTNISSENTANIESTKLTGRGEQSLEPHMKETKKGKRIQITKQSNGKLNVNKKPPFTKKSRFEKVICQLFEQPSTLKASIKPVQVIMTSRSPRFVGKSYLLTADQVVENGSKAPTEKQNIEATTNPSHKYSNEQQSGKPFYGRTHAYHIDISKLPMIKLLKKSSVIKINHPLIPQHVLSMDEAVYYSSKVLTWQNYHGETDQTFNNASILFKDLVAFSSKHSEVDVDKRYEITRKAILQECGNIERQIMKPLENSDDPELLRTNIDKLIGIYKTKRLEAYAKLQVQKAHESIEKLEYQIKGSYIHYESWDP